MSRFWEWHQFQEQHWNICWKSWRSQNKASQVFTSVVSMELTSDSLLVLPLELDDLLSGAHPELLVSLWNFCPLFANRSSCLEFGRGFDSSLCPWLWCPTSALAKWDSWKPVSHFTSGGSQVVFQRALQSLLNRTYFWWIPKSLDPISEVLYNANVGSVALPELQGCLDIAIPRHHVWRGMWISVSAFTSQFSGDRSPTF